MASEHAQLLAGPLAGASESQRRHHRWRFFQVTFFLMYVGVVLDVLTTAMGYERMGTAYEQNPLGAGLIGGMGWIGLLALLAALCALCYVSFRVVYFHMSMRWSAILNTVLVILLLARWVTVTAAVIYLVQPG
jgi:hypothetical protein